MLVSLSCIGVSSFSLRPVVSVRGGTILEVPVATSCVWLSFFRRERRPLSDISAVVGPCPSLPSSRSGVPSGPSGVPSARTDVVSMFTVLDGSCSVALEAAVLSDMLPVVVVEAVVFWASFCPIVVFVSSIFLPGGMAVFVTTDAYVVLIGPCLSVSFARRAGQAWCKCPTVPQP